MFNFFKKIIFLTRRPQFILIVGEGRFSVFSFFSKIVGFFPKKEKIIFLESNLERKKHLSNFNFFLRRSKKPILVLTHLAEISPFRTIQYLAKDKLPLNNIIKIKSLVRALPHNGLLVINSDDETIKEIAKETKAMVVSYGFSKGADLLVSDLKIDIDGLNFKVNFKENAVPLWLKKCLGGNTFIAL